MTDALDAIAAETGKPVPQIALNWLLQRPSVSTMLIGARNEAQLRQNLAAASWSLSPGHRAQLDAASFRMPPYPHYPYWNGQFAELNPPPVDDGMLDVGVDGDDQGVEQAFALPCHNHLG